MYKRVKNIKTHWDFVSLGSVAHIYNGNSINAEYKKKHFLGVDKGYPFIATKDVGFNGFIDYENGVKIPFDTDYKVADSDSVFICAEGGSGMLLNRFALEINYFV